MSFRGKSHSKEELHLKPDKNWIKKKHSNSITTICALMQDREENNTKAGMETDVKIRMEDGEENQVKITKPNQKKQLEG